MDNYRFGISVSFASPLECKDSTKYEDLTVGFDNKAGTLTLDNDHSSSKSTGFFSSTFFFGMIVFVVVTIILCVVILLVRRQKIKNNYGIDQQLNTEMEEGAEEFYKKETDK